MDVESEKSTSISARKGKGVLVNVSSYSMHSMMVVVVVVVVPPVSVVVVVLVVVDVVVLVVNVVYWLTLWRGRKKGARNSLHPSPKPVV